MLATLFNVFSERYISYQYQHCEFKAAAKILYFLQISLEMKIFNIKDLILTILNTNS